MAQRPENPFEYMDDLLAQWQRLEQLVKPLLCKSPGCLLSTQRMQNGTIRLCYNDVPMTEVKSQERVAAVESVEQFLTLWLQARDRMHTESKKSLDLLTKLVDQFEHVRAI